jgi:hypothetical protein
MNKVHEIYVQSRRLATLRLLSERPGYEVNTSVLHAALDALGFNSSRDVVEGECAWLAENGLVQVEKLDDSVVVVRLASRGLDVVQGNVVHPGVDRPHPSRF